MIELVTSFNIIEAAEIHTISWRESHCDICTEEFIALHTTERQMAYLQGQMHRGAAIYLLSYSGKGVGIVSVQGSVIGDLYVLPAEQRKGYGTTLLRFAVQQCVDTPTLWVLDHNRQAIRLYERIGFRHTGARKILSSTLSELEMQYVP